MWMGSAKKDVVTQRAIVGRFASICTTVQPNLPAKIHRSTWYSLRRLDHKEVVKVACRLDVCDRCFHVDKHVSARGQLARGPEIW